MTSEAIRAVITAAQDSNRDVSITLTNGDTRIGMPLVPPDRDDLIQLIVGHVTYDVALADIAGINDAEPVGLFRTETTAAIQ